MFSDVLLTVDFDRTLTDPVSVIPQRNIEAIRYFTENGGAFTVNTGRSVATLWEYMDQIPANAPFLLMNGSATYQNGKGTNLRLLDLDVWQTMKEMRRMFPDLNLEIQGLEKHYLIDPNKEYLEFYDNSHWRYAPAIWGQDVGPFLKFSLFGKVRRPIMADMFEGTEEEFSYFSAVKEEIERLYGDKVTVFRAAPRIIDVHTAGVSKLVAARDLQKELNKKILVCVGDAENDICMLEGADYAFCPSDGIVADRFPNVCTCSEGAVADVIYKEIPKILGILP